MKLMTNDWIRCYISKQLLSNNCHFVSARHLKATDFLPLAGPRADCAFGLLFAATVPGWCRCATLRLLPVSGCSLQARLVAWKRAGQTQTVEFFENTQIEDIPNTRSGSEPILLQQVGPAKSGRSSRYGTAYLTETRYRKVDYTRASLPAKLTSYWKF